MLRGSRFPSVNFSVRERFIWNSSAKVSPLHDLRSSESSDNGVFDVKSPPFAEWSKFRVDIRDAETGPKFLADPCDISMLSEA